jgi:hypothetical protein
MSQPSPLTLHQGDLSLTITLDPFQVTLARAGQQVLRAAPMLRPDGLRAQGAGLRADWADCSITLAPSPEGFSLQAAGEFRIAFELAGHWYGHGELLHQCWPLERVMLPLSPLQTFDNGPAGQSCILAPAWYASSGALIQAHSPLAVGLNQPPAAYPRYAWSLAGDKGPFAHRPFADPGGQGDGLLTLAGSDLHLTLSAASDAVSAFQRLLTQVGWPHATPPAALFIKPTWTTWARYKTEVSQAVVLAFAEEIIANAFPYGVLEIDDRWQTHYGDIAFDPARFPDPRAMIAQLHARGFQVTAWVIPFLAPESAAFAEGARRGFLVRQPDGEPYLVRWWQGLGGLLDVSNPAALDWFFARLRALQQATGLDGYKFDAGEACFLPPDARTYQPMHANDYSRRYVESVAAHYALAEVRSGWMNQAAPLFFRQWDKSSTWGLDNGLHSVLTGALSLGCAGYPFILPDMIGGNAYDGQSPSPELMIRWTQLNALLPAMQFSLAPWDYGDQCAALCRQAAELHVAFGDAILAAAAETVRTGAPLVRPLFWLAAQDERALTCDDEFLLGADLLVAPVLREGQRTRPVYLPPGTWRSVQTGARYQGPLELTEFPAPLEVLPLFLREA